MYERYTDEAKKVVFIAHLEAVHRDEQFISAKDILVALTWQAESRACKIASLKELAIPLRVSLDIPHLPSTLHPYLRELRIPLDNDAKMILAYTAMEADADHEYWIDTDHLLRGLLRFRNPAADALTRFGLSIKSVRSASISDRRGVPAKLEPKWAPPKRRFKRYGIRSVLIIILLLAFNLLMVALFVFLLNP